MRTTDPQTTVEQGAVQQFQACHLTTSASPGGIASTVSPDDRNRRRHHRGATLRHKQHCGDDRAERSRQGGPGRQMKDRRGIVFSMCDARMSPDPPASNRRCQRAQAEMDAQDHRHSR